MHTSINKSQSFQLDSSLNQDLKLSNIPGKKLEKEEKKEENKNNIIISTKLSDIETKENSCNGDENYKQSQYRKQMINLMLSNTKLIIKLLREEEIEQEEWSLENNEVDEFEELFDFRKSNILNFITLNDVLEIITKIKGVEYTSNYPHFYDRKNLIFDLEECLSKYCTMHGFSINYTN